MPTAHISHCPDKDDKNRKGPHQHKDNGWYATSYQGGNGGGAFDDSTYIDNILSATLIGVRIRAGEKIDNIQFCYMRDGHPFNTPAHGGGGGTDYEFDLRPGEYITRVEGRSGKKLDQIRFITNTGTSSRIYGGNGGDPFVWQAELAYPRSGLQWIEGRSGKVIDGLEGFFAQTIETSRKVLASHA